MTSDHIGIHMNFLLSASRERGEEMDSCGRGEGTEGQVRELGERRQCRDARVRAAPVAAEGS